MNVAHRNNKNHGKPNYNKAAGDRNTPRNNNRPADNKDKKHHAGFKGFASRCGLRHKDPCGYAIKALEAYYGAPITKEQELLFRKKLYDGYHLYQVVVSVENHFTSGYSFKTVGWIAATKTRTQPTLNISFWFVPDVVEGLPDFTKDLLRFSAYNLAKQLFSAHGMSMRICVDKEFYDRQGKFLSKMSWTHDEDQRFINVFGQEQNVGVKQLDLDRNNIVLVNHSVGNSIKIGLGLERRLLNKILGSFGFKMIIRPLEGFDLLDNDGKRLVSVDKCNKEKEIHYRKFDETLSDNVIEDIIHFGINYEQCDHKIPYDGDKIVIVKDETK